MKRIAITASIILVIIGFVVAVNIDQNAINTEFSIRTVSPYIGMLLCFALAYVLESEYVFNNDKN